MNIRFRFSSIVFVLVFFVCLILPSQIGAQPLTHVVVKGDTLWDICEKYYGNPNLWPKLWEMNPFVTNPHLLEPGDVITLFEGGLSNLQGGLSNLQGGLSKSQEGSGGSRMKGVPGAEEGGKIPQPTPLATGVDVSSIININAIGYLSHSRVRPWGHLYLSNRERIMLGRNDTIFVSFDKGKEVKPGDEFSVCRYSPSLTNPVGVLSVGRALSVRGRLVVEEPVAGEMEEDKRAEGRTTYKARILDSYQDIRAEDFLIPYEPVSPCVQPRSLDREVTANIVSVKDQMELIGLYSIVYINRGFNQGIRRGDLLEVVEKRPNPAWRVELPDRVLGNVMVLESMPDTATAVVLSAEKDLANGVEIKGLSYVEPPGFISRLPTCPVE